MPTRYLSLILGMLFIYAKLQAQSACYRVATHSKISNTRGLFTGPNPSNDNFGAPASIGDLNSDGISDIAVGAPNDDDGGADRGAVWVILLDEYGRVKGEQKISSTQGGFIGTLANSDFFGQEVAGIGDIDGDNIPDIAVGANGDDDGGPGRGAVWILFLNTNGTVKAQQKISDLQGNFTGTLNDNDFFGSNLGAPGDVNKDGFNDLAVGAFGDDDGASGAGAVWILFLNNTGNVISYQKISATQGGFTGILDAGDRFSSPGGLGDLNGDGKVDLAVGAERDDDGGVDFGAVWILFLDTVGNVLTQQKISATTGGFSGTLSSNEYFGSNVRAVGDLDTDGNTDLVVGSPADDDGGTDRGSFYLVYLNANGTVKGEQHFSDIDGNFLGRLDNTDLFGRFLCFLGDFNGDGLQDVAVSAHNDDDGASNSGATWILSLQPCQQSCVALPQQNTFQKTYVAPFSDRGHSLLKLSDGYLLSGMTNSAGAGGNDLFLIRTNLKGDTLWSKTYGGSGNDWGNSVSLRAAADSGFIISAATSSFNPGNNAYVIRIGATGNIIWQKRLAMGNSEHARGLEVTSDSGFVVVGTNGMVFKLDKNGNLLWDKFYNLTAPFNTHFIHVIETYDFGLMILGEFTLGGGGREAVLVKLDSLGNKIWEKTYDSPGQDGFMYGFEDENTYFLLGVTIVGGSNPFFKPFVLRVDSAGHEIWSRYYNSGTGLDRGSCAIKMSNGRYALTGYNENFGVNRNVIMQMDQYGNLIWSKAFPGNGISLESFWSENIHESDDGGLVFLNYASEFGTSNYDVMLMKLNGCGEVGCNETDITYQTEEWPFTESSSNSIITSGATLSNVISQISVFPVNDSTLCEFKSACSAQADFNADTVCLGDTTFFTDLSVDSLFNIVDWKWYTGTGDSLSGNVNVSYQYSSSGTFPVTLVVSSDDSLGCTDTITKPVVVLDVPVVNLGNDTAFCMGDSIILNAWDSGSTYLWQNASTDSILVVKNSGAYYVEVSNMVCPSASDTIDVQVHLLPVVFLGNDTTLCTGDSLLLDATVSGGSYLWQNNSINPSFLVKSPGTYKVVVDSGLCSSTDSIVVSYINPPVVDLGNDTTLCFGDSVMLNAGNFGLNILWQDNSTDTIYIADTTGIFYVQVSNGLCATVWDSISIQFDLPPNIDLGNDTTVCQGATVTLSALTSGATYLWQDLSTNPTFQVNTAGTYYVDVDSGVCSSTDTITVHYEVKPTVNLGPDTVICEGVSYVLNAFQAGVQYLWSTSDTTSAIHVNVPGAYWVEVKTPIAHCTKADTVQIDIQPTPFVDLGRDTAFCIPGSITLKAAFPGAHPEWWDSSTDSVQEITQTGNYWVTMYAGLCSYTDSIRVQVDSLPDIHLDPHYYRCEGDSLNITLDEGWNYYSWSNGDSSFRSSFSDDGSYWVVIGSGVCSDTGFFEFSHVARPEEHLEDTAILCDTTFVLLDAGNEGYTYIWSTQEFSRQILVSQEGWYTVAISNRGQCIVRDSIYVELCKKDFFIPNTITPNGDGSNDSWIIEGIEDYPGNRVLIFNRNGFLLFDTSDYKNNWDATYNNTPLPDAVYFFVLELNNGQKPYKGTITVIRENR